MKPNDYTPHKELTFADFKTRARDDSLSAYEKIGFPSSYREGKEELIFADIRHKLSNLDKPGGTILDIGPGCSGPAFLLIEWCRHMQHQLILVDSAEMLSHLPDESFLLKVAGKFPDECASRLLSEFRGRVSAIICYSVLHYIFAETNLFDFLDRSLPLLAEGGEMLIGDIPNISKRNRFFSSAAGARFHQNFVGRMEAPKVNFNSLVEGKIDDAVLFGMLQRARAAGFDAYIVPQPLALPMANRREDLLIVKP